MHAKVLISLPLVLVSCASSPIARDNCQEQEKIAYATTELRLRAQPTTESLVLLTLPRAARVALGDCNLGWCKADYFRSSDGREFSGYVAQAYVSSTRPAVQATRQPRACCKICRRGKACGDSCISRSYTCRKGPGCACNG